MDDYVPISRRSAAALRTQADEYRRMAQTARLADTAASLRKLAARLEALADEREREGG
jgi:hypothetical protein